MKDLFIHLRTYSSYSLASGAIKLPEIANLAVKNNMPAVAMTDKNNLFGMLEFSLDAIKKGVQPIIGAAIKIIYGPELLVANNLEETCDDILIIAKNEAGYKNLLKIVSNAYLESAASKENAISFAQLKESSEGLIIISGDHKGQLADLLRNNQRELAVKIAKSFQEILKEDFYLELQRHDLQSQKLLEGEILSLAKELNIPIVATNDVHFAKMGMYEAHDVLSCIAAGEYVDDVKRKRLTREHYFKSSREMIRLFKDLPEAIENTVKIAKKCSFFPEGRDPMLPHYESESGLSEEEELSRQAKEGLDEYLKDRDDLDEAAKKEYYERLDYELSIINKMGFPGYFLIVSDFIKWSKENNIPVGPGRGSGAGSIVAWAMKITDLDPIKFGLIFERFLNPQRVSMPDFDIDFCQERRDEVIGYVRRKYGDDRVAQIITFGKLQAKAVIKDVGRVLQMPYKQIDDISKMIPFNPVAPVTLQQAIDMDKSLREMRDSDSQIAKLLDIGLKLEGLNRHASTHAAGIVIADQNLTEIVPLYKDPRSDMPVVQYSMKYSEIAGLVKFDFLGLKTLTTIVKTVELLKAQGIELDINKIPLDDANSFKMLARGDSSGVFQLESSGMKDCLRKMHLDTFEEIIALISLYRPGPMDNIPDYIARKHGKMEVEYPHPLLEDCLKETFGVIIYQEQVMQIAQILAGYSLGDADLLRRAMGKKIKAEMDAQREIFVTGAVKNNIDKKQASEIFDLVAKFAGYGFNKSHAAAYALIGYQTAYLKANHPVEFIVANLNLEINDTDKLNLFIQEAKYLKIEILPPDINKSHALFSIEKNEKGEKAIRYAFAAIKSVGRQAMHDLEKIRKEKGNFTDIFDFIEKAGSSIVNKRQFENLARSGCFDEFYPNRNELFSNVELITKYASSYESDQQSSQASLFGDDMAQMIRPPLQKFSAWDEKEKLLHEFSAIGFYLTKHPLDNYRFFLDKINVIKQVEFEEKIKGDMMDISLAGVIINYKQRSGKNGRFATVAISDPTGVFEISIFDDALIEASRHLLINGQKIFIKAIARNDEGNIRFQANSLEDLDLELRNKKFKINFEIDDLVMLDEINTALRNKGEVVVSGAIHFKSQDKVIKLDLNEEFKISGDFMSYLNMNKIKIS